MMGMGEKTPKYIQKQRKNPPFGCPPIPPSMAGPAFQVFSMRVLYRLSLTLMQIRQINLPSITTINVLFINIYVYIYIHIYICVCVCVCVY